MGKRRTTICRALSVGLLTFCGACEPDHICNDQISVFSIEQRVDSQEADRGRRLMAAYRSLLAARRRETFEIIDGGSQKLRNGKKALDT